MEFEEGFTPDDAQIKFMFMLQAFVETEKALADCNDPIQDWINGVFSQSELNENTSHASAFRDKRAKENLELEIANMQQMHRSSYFLMAFALCESSLTMFADRFLQQVDSKFSTKDLKGPITEKVKKVMSLYSLDLTPVRRELWVAFTDYQKIRNVITHGGGLLQDSSSITELMAIANKCEGVYLVDFGSPSYKRFEFHDAFIRQAIPEMEQLVSEVAKSFFGIRGPEC